MTTTDHRPNVGAARRRHRELVVQIDVLDDVHVHALLQRRDEVVVVDERGVEHEPVERRPERRALAHDAVQQEVVDLVVDERELAQVRPAEHAPAPALVLGRVRVLLAEELEELGRRRVDHRQVRDRRERAREAARRGAHARVEQRERAQDGVPPEPRRAAGERERGDELAELGLVEVREREFLQVRGLEDRGHPADGVAGQLEVAEGGDLEGRVCAARMEVDVGAAKDEGADVGGCREDVAELLVLEARLVPKPAKVERDEVVKRGRVPGCREGIETDRRERFRSALEDLGEEDLLVS